MITTISVDSSEIFSERPKDCHSCASRNSLPYHSVVKPVHHLLLGCRLKEQQHRVYHAQLIADAFLFHAVHRPPSITSALLTRAYRYTKIMVPAIRNTDSALPSGQLREDMN